MDLLAYNEIDFSHIMAESEPYVFKPSAPPPARVPSHLLGLFCDLPSPLPISPTRRGRLLSSHEVQVGDHVILTHKLPCLVIAIYSTSEGVELLLRTTQGAWYHTIAHGSLIQRA